eukprot:CAMPEP_0115520064 /NCGR_PEP_ID=MMETSP0271-20121206/78778_1 /TAXON_ID=71861 /ORGANISM="Scrippsiella trochoidea, Strain CCMP3099" /LENGTH=270 /DNA_ID=CAMNT_0002951133 /DNA_START=122 /DNA_END=931 /DNA_ORIENTATION=-
MSAESYAAMSEVDAEKVVATDTCNTECGATQWDGIDFTTTLKSSQCATCRTKGLKMFSGKCKDGEEELGRSSSGKACCKILDGQPECTQTHSHSQPFINQQLAEAQAVIAQQRAARIAAEQRKQAAFGAMGVNPYPHLNNMGGGQAAPVQMPGNTYHYPVQQQHLPPGQQYYWPQHPPQQYPLQQHPQQQHPHQQYPQQQPHQQYPSGFRYDYNPNLGGSFMDSESYGMSEVDAEEVLAMDTCNTECGATQWDGIDFTQTLKSSQCATCR